MPMNAVIRILSDSPFIGIFGGWEKDPKKKKGANKGKKRKQPRPKAKKEEGSFDTTVSKEAKGLVLKMREELLKQIEALGEKLPPNTLDQLIDELGGPTEVAEVCRSWNFSLIFQS